MWNSKTKFWDTNVASLLKAVDFHSAAVINDRIYVTGGRINKDGKYKSINEVQVYSVESNSWSYAAPMVQKREDHSSIEIKGMLYVAGGFFRETDSNLDRVESYNLDANLWTAYCNLPSPTYSPSLCFFRNKLLCMGGYNGKDKINNVWEYDDINSAWKALKNLSKKRYLANALVIPYHSII
ncbi:ectoderm-neural cortex protein 1-like [Arctopsyche grandis]|uniref:ectoderm-neural cortex protein 1-like n=1 Tax=Arctopsyche grandis TaxID=121162 RepID=UPI00406D887A